MAVNTHQRVPRDASMNGGGSTRGFWTQRRRSATSLATVIGLIAGIAVAYKLFDQTVPNNAVRDAATFDFVVYARDLAAGEVDFHDTTGTSDEVVFRQSMADPACSASQPPNATVETCNVDMFPGDSRTSEVLITNTNLTPAKDASFEVYVAPSSITVYRYDNDVDDDGIVDPEDTDFDGDSVLDEYHVVSSTSPEWSSFVNFWSLGVQKQTYWMDPISRREAENDPTASGSYATACASVAIVNLGPGNPCKLGVVRSNGSFSTAFPIDPEPGNTLGIIPSRPSDDRQYNFTLTELDDSSDQSPYLGWRVSFTLVFTARLTPEPESGRYSTLPVPDNQDGNDPVCTTCP